jgi:hypothetical protein
MSTMSLFQHAPLNDLKRQIRFLRFKSFIDFDDGIIVELTAYDLERAPNYVAISYAWGIANPLSTIMVNGGTMAVGPNCEYALRQIRRRLKGS